MTTLCETRTSVRMVNGVGIYSRVMIIKQSLTFSVIRDKEDVIIIIASVAIVILTMTIIAIINTNIIVIILNLFHSHKHLQNKFKFWHMTFKSIAASTRFLYSIFEANPFAIGVSSEGRHRGLAWSSPRWRRRCCHPSRWGGRGLGGGRHVLGRGGLRCLEERTVHFIFL